MIMTTGAYEGNLYGCGQLIMLSMIGIIELMIDCL